MESEFWKSIFIIDNTAYYLAGFKNREKAVFQVNNTNLYKCYTYDEVMGMTASQELVTWEQASEFLR